MLRGSLLLVLLVAALGACTLPPVGYRALLTGPPTLSLVGDVALDPHTGEVILRLPPDACTVTEERLYDNGKVEEEKSPCRTVPWVTTRLHTPWGQVLAPKSGSPDTMVFAVDWNLPDVDPLAPGAAAQFDKPWAFTGDSSSEVLWKPDARVRELMVALVGEATDTQVTVAEVSAPPKVVVTAVRFETELRNGTDNELVVTVTNEGAGDAYRLSATTRSNVPSLHGIRFSFGRLVPGASKTRRVRVRVPRANDEAHALVVLAFEEAHRYTPAQSSLRFPVRPAVDLAVLAMTCRFDDLTGERPRVDAGMTLHVTCTVRNEGTAAGGLRLRAGYVDGKTLVESAPFDLGADRSLPVRLALEVPRDAKLDSVLTVHLVARHDLTGVQTRASLAVEVARPQLCPDGKFTRARFNERRAELKRKLDAGLIRPEDYEKYEAELVGCLE